LDNLDGSQPFFIRAGVSTLLGEKNKSCTAAVTRNNEKQNLVTKRTIKFTSFSISFNVMVDLILQNELDQMDETRTSRTLTATGIGRYEA
jgi:hypothetical protein